MQPNNPLSTPEAPIEQQPAPIADQNANPSQPAQNLENAAPLESKKRSKKPLIATLIAIIVVLIALITIGVIQANKANDAAANYKTDVLQNVEAIRAGPEASDRLKHLNEKVADLPDVWLGEIVSGTYREAVDVEKRYNTLIEETTPFFEETYMFFELPDFLEQLNKLVVRPLADESASVSAYAKSLEDRAADYDKTADTLKSYYFAPEYADVKNTIITELHSMSEAMKKRAELNLTADNVVEAVKPYSEQHEKSYIAIRQLFQNDVIKYYDALASRIPGEADETDKKFETFINSLK